MTFFCSLPYFWYDTYHFICMIGPLLKWTYHQLSNVERRPLLEYLPSLGRGTAIHLRIGHPYISPADVRPSNGFGSLAYNKDATVVVPAVAAVGRPPPPPPPPPIVRKLHYVLSNCVCMLFLFGWPPCQRSDMTLMEVSQRALDSLYIRNIWLLYIVIFFVNLIWYLYLFWLNKHCLSLCPCHIAQFESLKLYEFPPSLFLNMLLLFKNCTSFVACAPPQIELNVNVLQIWST